MDEKKNAQEGPASQDLSHVTNPQSTSPRRRTPWDTVEGRVISLVSRKGGVGKTTSAVNLGAALALSEHSVLIIGTDPQCGVSRTLGFGPEDLSDGLRNVFDEGKALNDIAQPSGLPGLFFVSPRILSLDDEEAYLEQMADQVDDFVAAVDRARNLYDTILIDCPPNLGAATRASLMASDTYLVPVQAEELCRDSLGNLLDFIGTFRERNFGAAATSEDAKPLEMEGLFLTMSNIRTRMGQRVAARVDEDFGDLLFDAGIPRTVRLSEMAVKGKPAVIYDRRSPGSRAYFDLADELVNRFCHGHLAAADVHEALAEATLEQAVQDVMRAEARESTEPEQPAGGLDRFLADLADGPETRVTQVSPFEDNSLPEMVSLDELLVEEERGGASDGTAEWDDGYWPAGKDRDSRYN